MQQQSGNNLKTKINGEVSLAFKNPGETPTSKLNGDPHRNRKEEDFPMIGEDESPQLTTRSASTVTNLDTSAKNANARSAKPGTTIIQTSALTSPRRNNLLRMNVLMRMLLFLLSILK